jgi:acid phosphatase family membrane protein YuiD
MNRALRMALLTIGFAQFLKIPIKKAKTREWDWSLFFETGGMPSSHSAGVSSLATYIALKRGIRTIDFALAALFGLIVMYDAQGVRRQAGELAIRLNGLAEEIKELKGDPNEQVYEQKKQRIREQLGHQPIEVIGGAILGIFMGAIGYFLDQRKQHLS